MKSENKYELIKFEDGDFSLDVNVSPNEDTVWLSLDEISILFDRDKSVISRHIKNIFIEQELEENSVIAYFATTAADGKTGSRPAGAEIYDPAAGGTAERGRNCPADHGNR